MSFWVSFFYWGAFSMLAISAGTGHWIMQQPPMRRPMNTTLIDKPSAFAGWFAVVAAVFAIWKDGWFAVAYLVLCLGFIVPIEIRRMRARVDAAPFWTITLGLAGALLETVMIGYLSAG